MGAEDRGQGEFGIKNGASLRDTKSAPLENAGRFFLRRPESGTSALEFPK